MATKLKQPLTTPEMFQTASPSKQQVKQLVLCFSQPNEYINPRLSFLSPSSFRLWTLFKKLFLILHFNALKQINQTDGSENCGA